MNKKNEGIIRIDCVFSTYDEEFTLEYKYMGEGWYRGSLKATQCGLVLAVPFIFLEEHFCSFLAGLKKYDNQLDIPLQAVTLYDFTTQNGIVTGPLVPHQGKMFLDVFIDYDSRPDQEHLGTFVPDRYEDRYLKIRRQLTDYPVKFGPRPYDEKFLNKHGLQLIYDNMISGNTNQPENVPYGMHIRLSGLQYDRNQIPRILSDQGFKG